MYDLEGFSQARKAIESYLLTNGWKPVTADDVGLIWLREGNFEQRIRLIDNVATVSDFWDVLREVILTLQMVERRPRISIMAEMFYRFNVN